MTFEERVEKAEAVLVDRHMMPPGRRGDVRELLQAAFPDLYGEKPSAWIAPWEADDELLTVLSQEPRVGKSTSYPDGWVSKEAYAAMRDSHLSTLKGEKRE